jgi:hypothetical protein
LLPIDLHRFALKVGVDGSLFVAPHYNKPTQAEVTIIDPERFTCDGVAVKRHVMPKYDLILFDADGRLFDYDHSEGMALEKAFAQYRLPYSEDKPYRAAATNSS